MDISKSIKFHDLCQKFEKIKNTNEISMKEKKLLQTLNSFLDYAKEFREKNGDVGKSSFYCLLRCLLPDSDNSRESYGIQITTLGKIYIKILQLPLGGSFACKLLHRSHANGPQPQHQDYADIVYSVLKTRTTDTPSEITLFEIHAMLDKISSEDRRSVENVLTELSEKASAFEQKWFIRLLLKRMNLGIGEARIFSILHPRAKEYYSRCSDLEKVCLAIERGDELCLDKSIVPFSHVRPMLCERLKTDCLYQMMGNDTVYAETKMDGERFQLHKQDDTFKYISRNGADYTKYFGSNPNEGNLTPLIMGLLDTSVKNIILDGEMMVWDKEAESFRVKGENFDVKHLHPGGNLRPCFVVYDLIYLNGKCLTEKAYGDRMARLQNCFKPQVGVLQLGKRTKLCTLQHFMDIFNEALDANEEGVVIKLHRSKYTPGSRTGGWYKVKADYIQGLVADMDMLIMGGYYNRTKTFINSYLVGVIEGDESDAKLHCVGKVAIGLSTGERNTLNASLSSKWKRGFMPKHLRFGNLSPDVWIEPNDSIVLKLKASELGQASSFATPYSLRFPRIEEIRNDKPWFESMTLREYESFYEGDHGVKKINKRGLNDDDMVSSKKPRTSSSKTKSSTTVYSNTFNSSEISAESTILEDFNFCILSSLRGSHSVNKLKGIVIKNGGNLVENPSPADYKCICIAGDITQRVEDLCKTGYYNVVSCKWLIDTAERKRMQLKPRDMISSTPELKEQLKELFDSHGDSFTDHIDEKELQELLGELKSTDTPLLLEHEMSVLEDAIYGENSSPNFFRNSKAVFYNQDGLHTLSHASTVAKLTFQWRGGTCPPEIQTPEGERKIEYVFADLNKIDMNAFEMWFLVTFPKRLLKVQVVSIDWIADSDKEGKRLPIDNYLIKF